MSSCYHYSKLKHNLEKTHREGNINLLLPLKWKVVIMSNSSQSATSFSTILFFPALTFHVFDKLWNSHLKNDGVGWQCVRDIRAKKFSFFLSKGQAWKWFNLIFLFTGTAEINHNKLSIGAMERFFKKDGKIKMLLAFRASLATYRMDWELWQLIISCISKKTRFLWWTAHLFLFQFQIKCELLLQICLVCGGFWVGGLTCFPAHSEFQHTAHGKFSC